LDSLNFKFKMHMLRYGWNERCHLIVLGMMLMLPVVNAESPEDVRERLQKLIDNISTLESIISEDSESYANLEVESQQLDKAIGALHGRLQATAEQLEASQKRLYNLQAESQIIQQRLDKQRIQLKQQLVSAYQFNSHSRWQFILNHQSLQNVGRNSVIYEYLHAAQLKQIKEIQQVYQQLRTNREQLAGQHQSQARLYTQQQREHELLNKARKQKKSAKHALSQLIDENTQALQSEQEDKRVLTQLLAQLMREKHTGNQAFGDYRGKLAWPIKGTFKSRFGQQKSSSSDMHWTGVSVAAQTGTQIRAIFSGTVVFADWFDRYGWLTIIDHGNNYMSLYAHAEGLYKKNGEHVTQGEVIAIVGDSGETLEPNLYFEIRDNGNPVDPALWCRRS